ncbi:unnamed protein product [Cylicocyclus nassatus]|uniref:C-type lectin n=1 Tax=Cylicocyclus nassatus TaxID=53992 RepID=A0AA36M474_CYLNA|nr:unnamed protein product [Cylicocyclus nassatus]
MGSLDNIRSEFDLIETWIVPQLDMRWGYVEFSFTGYGAVPNWELLDATQDKAWICSKLEEFWRDTSFPTTPPPPLSETIRMLFNDFWMYNQTSLVLFTGDRNQSDVDDAALQVQYYIDNKIAIDFSIVIVNYDPTYTTQLPVYSTLPPADSANVGCECNYGTIWLDVFLLMEATTSMQFGIDGATEYMVSAFTKLTVGQAEQYQTRFGVIRYATEVQLIADLDTYKSTADLLNLEIKTYNDLGTNIEGALKMATDRFKSSVHRIAARPVVIIVGNSYRSGDYNDPSQAAASFREDGGTIITIEYVQEHGLEVPYLRSLASPNYNLTNEKNDGTQLVANDLRDLLCKANCFCGRNWLEYNLDKWNAPQGGCYYPVSIPAIQSLAQRTCTHDHNSTLALVEDFAKDSFLMSIFPSKTKFWLGLTNDDDGWKWQGGYSAGYTNWGPDQPGSGRCAYMQQYSGFRFAWFSDECSDDKCYICQSKPCDSTKYCETNF